MYLVMLSTRNCATNKYSALLTLLQCTFLLIPKRVHSLVECTFIQYKTIAARGVVAAKPVANSGNVMLFYHSA